jgi:hypothetical protein
MPVSELDQWVSDAAAEVLETMFFTSLAAEGEPVPPVTAPFLSVRLSFRGAPPGRLGLRVPVETGRRIAANFLGIDEASDSQIEDVLCELSNMVCGSVLSRLESESVFELSHPEIGPRETRREQTGPSVSRTVALDEGVIEIWLELGSSE